MSEAKKMVQMRVAATAFSWEALSGLAERIGYEVTRDEDDPTVGQLMRAEDGVPVADLVECRQGWSVRYYDESGEDDSKVFTAWVAVDRIEPRLYVSCNRDHVAVRRDLVNDDELVLPVDVAEYGDSWSPAATPVGDRLLVKDYEGEPVLVGVRRHWRVAVYDEKVGVVESRVVGDRLDAWMTRRIARYLGWPEPDDLPRSQMDQKLIRLGLTQTEAAEVLGVHSRQRVGEWVRGERRTPSYIDAHLDTLLELGLPTSRGDR